MKKKNIDKKAFIDDRDEDLKELMEFAFSSEEETLEEFKRIHTMYINKLLDGNK